MVENNIILISQLVNSLKQKAVFLEEAYNNNDKEKFDVSKEAILEMQKKINFLLSEMDM